MPCNFACKTSATVIYDRHEAIVLIVRLLLLLILSASLPVNDYADHSVLERRFPRGERNPRTLCRRAHLGCRLVGDLCINGFIQNFNFLAFATPPQTNSQGLFTDTPIGSCFNVDPFSSLNPCVFVDQHFDIVVPNDAGSPRSIITVTHRKDCRRGIRVEVQNGPVTNTYTLGEVP
jgi:hypothetical protein